MQDKPDAMKKKMSKFTAPKWDHLLQKALRAESEDDNHTGKINATHNMMQNNFLQKRGALRYKGGKRLPAHVFKKWAKDA